MASKKKRPSAKSKRGKTQATSRKKAVKRTAARKVKSGAKRRTSKARRSTARRPAARQQMRAATPVIEQTVIDVVDEPLPGVVRVTEIEETDVSLKDEDNEE